MFVKRLLRLPPIGSSSRKLIERADSVPPNPWIGWSNVT
jgi:hypothetical protein